MAKDELTLEQVSQLLDEKLKDLATKQDLVDNNKEMIDAVENYLSKYPTKDEFYKSEDKIVGEIRDSRDEVDTHNGIVQENRERIEKLEKQVFKN